MKKRCLKVLSLSILLSTFAFTGCGNQIEITFVGDNGSITRKIDKGQNIDADKIPATPQKPGKYCLWDDVDFSSLTEDTTINYTCYDSVKTLTSNINHSIEVVVSSEEASLDYILKDLQMTATLEDGNVKKLYKGDYKVNENGYSKDVVGNYRVGLAYNNKEIFLSIHVTKITDYVTAVLSSDRGYLNEGLPKITANTEVPGTIKFDDNQTLVIGTKSYNWTFTPSDTNKYAVVHGKSEVNIINATSIVTNKENEVMTFDYGTSKTTIINAIQEGLKVTGTFGNIYREIDPQFYVIDSEYKDFKELLLSFYKEVELITIDDIYVAFCFDSYNNDISSFISTLSDDLGINFKLHEGINITDNTEGKIVRKYIGIVKNFFVKSINFFDLLMLKMPCLVSLFFKNLSPI